MTRWIESSLPTLFSCVTRKECVNVVDFIEHVFVYMVRSIFEHSIHGWSCRIPRCWLEVNKRKD